MSRKKSTQPKALSATLAALVILAAGGAARAAYLEDVPVVLTQPDGSEVPCLATGDEFYHRYHDAEGFTLVRDPLTGYWVYGREEAGDVAATPFVAGSVDPREEGLLPGARISDSRFADFRRSWDLPEGTRAEDAPTIGVIRQIVIFIRFSDEAEWTDPLSLYEGRFNSSEAEVNSLFNYYQEVSHQQLEVYAHFFPTQTGDLVVSYQSVNPRGYYQPYDASANPGGYKPSQKTTREHALLAAAVEAVNDQVPADLAIDADGDGKVDNVNFLIRGRPDGGDILWPHRWSLYTQTVRINEKLVQDYNLNLQSMADVGTLAHEFFHTLGAPDLYHYSYDGIAPCYRWDLMEGTRNPPQHMMAYMKRVYGHWVGEIPEITQPGVYTLNPATSTENFAYRIPSPNSDLEFFMVEYRRKEGTFENSIPGTGLLIYRINRLAEGIGNRDGPPDEVYIYRPWGAPDKNGAPFMAHFTSDEGRTALNDDTSGAAAMTTSYLQDGSPGGLRIAQIGPAGETISFELGSTNICWVGCTVDAAPVQGPAPLQVQFTGHDRMFDCEGPLSYNWEFGDGLFGQGETVTHTYGAPGAYQWTLTLTVGGNSGSTGGVVEVTEPCSLACDASADAELGRAPLTVNFQGEATPRNCSGTPAFAWEFGDGGTSAEQSPAHEYAEQGTYTWTLTVAVEGITCSRQGTVVVEPAVPGDCNGDDGVSIGEVQKAINMFLGAEPPGCGVDVNGDGTVSIGEVQQVINAFLG